MKHFIVEIAYRVPADQLGEVVAQHRAFLQTGYDSGMLLFSGPQEPRTGGMAVARAESLEEVQAFFAQDPYHLSGLADHHFTEFNPIKLQPFIKNWVEGGKGESIGRRFMAGTKTGMYGPSRQKQGLPQPPLELPANSSAPVFDLPDPADLILPPMDFRQMLVNRKTHRVYTGDTLSLAEFSFLLWATQGVKEVTARPATTRTVPSAGSRHAFETYLLVNRVEGLVPGLYRYLALSHRLVLVDDRPDVNARLTAACMDQMQIQNSAVTFFWTAVLARMYWRYDERGYRYLHLDAGHVCQNLYLAAEMLGCGVCAIGAYDDDLLNQELGLDGEEQFMVYGGTLGKVAS
jgi:SagB-type dehydrogenase family enzyme